MGDGSWRSGHSKRLNSQGYRKPLQQNQNPTSRPCTTRRQPPSTFLQNQSQSHLNLDFDPINEHYGRSLNTPPGFPIQIFTTPGYPPPPTAYATPFCHVLGKRPFSPPFDFEVESSTPNPGQDQVDHDLNPIETGYQGCRGHHNQRMRPIPQNFLSPPSRAHCGCCAGQSAIICLPRSGCPCPPAAPSDISNNGNESSRPISQPLADILEKSASFNNCNFYCSGISGPPTPTPQGHVRCSPSPPAKFACSNPKQTPDDYYADPGEIIYSDYFKYGMNYVNQGKESKLKSRKVGVGRSIYKILKKKTQKFCTVDVGVGEIKTATTLCENNNYYHPWDVQSCYTSINNQTVTNSNRNQISSAQKVNNKDSCIHSEMYNPLISRQGNECKRLQRGNMHRNKIEEYKRATPHTYSSNIGMPQTVRVRENYTINNHDEFSHRGENNNRTTDSKFKLASPVPSLTTATSVTQMSAVNAFVVKSRSRRFKLRNGKSRLFPIHPLDLQLVKYNEKTTACNKSSPTVTEPQHLPTCYPGCLNTEIQRSAVYQNQNCEYENQNPRHEFTILPPPTAFAAPSPLFQCYHQGNSVSNAEESAAGTTNTEETTSADITSGIEVYSSFEPYLANSNSTSKSAAVKDSNIISGREPATPDIYISTSRDSIENTGSYNFKGNTINTTFSQEKEPKSEPDIASDSEPDYPPERFDYMSEKNMNVISTLVVSSYTNSSRHFINIVGSSSNSAIKDSSGEESPEEIYTGTSKLSLHIKRSSASNPRYPAFSDENSNSIWGDDHQSISISDSNFENYSSSKDGNKNCIISPSGHLIFSPCQIQPKKRSRTTSTRTSEKREIYVEAQLNGAEMDNGQDQKEGASLLTDHKHGFVDDKEKLVNMNILEQGQHLPHLSRHHGHDYVVMHSFYSPKIKRVVLQKCGEDEKGEIFLVERKGRRKHRLCTNVCPCPKNKTIYLQQVDDSPIIRCLDHDLCPHANKPSQQNQKIASSTGPYYSLHGRILQNQSTSSSNHSLFKKPSILHKTGNSSTGQSQLSQTSNNNLHGPTFAPFNFSSPGQFCCGPYGPMIPFQNYVPPWSTHYARSCRGSYRVPRSTRPSYYSSCCRDLLPQSRSFIKKRDDDRYSAYYHFRGPTPKRSPSETSQPNTPTLEPANQSKSNTETNPGESKRVKIISTPPISMSSSSNVILPSPLPTPKRAESSEPESELATPTNTVSSVAVTAVPSVPSIPSSKIPSRDLGIPRNTIREASASLIRSKQDEQGVTSMVTETSETEAKQELPTETQTEGAKTNNDKTPSQTKPPLPLTPMVTETSETEAKQELPTETQTEGAKTNDTKPSETKPPLPLAPMVTETSETEAKQELSTDTQTQWPKMNATKPSQTKPPLPLTSLLKTDIPPVNNSPIKSCDLYPCFPCCQPCDPCYPPLCDTFCPQLCAYPCLYKKRNKKQRHRSNTKNIMVCPHQPNGCQAQQQPAPVLSGDGACCNFKRTRNATNHNLNNGLNQSKKCCADMLQLMFPSMFATQREQEQISCKSQPISALLPSTAYSTATGVSPQTTNECQNTNSTSFQVQLGQICCLKPLVPTTQSQAQSEFRPQMMSQSCSIPVGGCPKQKNILLSAFQPQSHSGCKAINNATNISSSSCSYAKSSITTKHRGSCKRRVNGGRKHL